MQALKELMAVEEAKEARKEKQKRFVFLSIYPIYLAFFLYIFLASVLLSLFSVAFVHT